MKFYHALTSAAFAVEDANRLCVSLQTTTDDPELPASIIGSIFGVSGFLDMCAYRSIAGGAPRERVLDLFQYTVAAIAKSRAG